MSKVITVQLEWKYSPENYLEEPIAILFEGGDLEIKDGIAIAKIDPDLYHPDSSIREILTRQIENRLHAVQIMTHRDFELSKSSRADIRDDGRKNHFLEVESCVMTMSLGTIDLIVKDKDGNVVSDTKKERLDKQKHLAILIDKHRNSDSTLDQMLKSYQKSVKDPDDELVHLYEIRDSLSERFGSKGSAIHKLGITITDWGEIGKIANTLPLKQGRHRGKAVGALRDADIAELEEARKSVVYLIEKYLEYLETC
ncbi:putative ferric uptake regulation protein [Nitrosomonas sp. Is79A3]|uniref:hypothetical protein n=1 Tax=Nitrosomonas sp. (strain Is79A3) TaxID=261292 RepID=UPI000215C84B